MTTALEWYSRSVAQNNEVASFSLGLLYYYGENGLKKDQWKAFDLIKKASKLGNKHATQWLDENVYTNNSPKGFVSSMVNFLTGGKDEKFLKSKEEDKSTGHGQDSLFELGLSYYFGRSGVKKDEWKGFDLIKKASKLGDIRATNWLNNNIYSKKK